jgi:hypothetical protein
MAWKVGMVHVGWVIGALLAGSWCSSTPPATAVGLPAIVSSGLSHPDAAAGGMQAGSRQAPFCGKRSAGPSIRARDIAERPPKLLHDLRRPRPPRHRSERPSTGVALLGNELTVELLEFLDDPYGGRFVPFPAACLPLAGHPSAILRPPSPRG